MFFKQYLIKISYLNLDKLAGKDLVESEEE